MPNNAQEIWALKQSIQGMSTDLESARKQSKTLLVLGMLCLIAPFALLLSLKLEAFTWSIGFVSGLGLFFIQLSMTTNKAWTVSKYTKQYVQLGEMKKRLAKLES